MAQRLSRSEGPSGRGANMPPVPEDEKDEAPVKALDEDDIALLKTYGLGPYAQRIKDAEAGAVLRFSALQ